jgi:ATP-dependent DNA helicase RecG
MLCYPKKAVLMAPTSILANQIYAEAKRFLPQHLKIALVTSKEKRDDLGSYDFLVGTHALLYKDLPKCDLVMVDEQHRFGVNQREMIKHLVSRDKSSRAHFLQFSATPIPRTLAMINSSLVDYSSIKEIPFEKHITTKIIGRSGFKSLIKHIEEEISKDHQIAIIYPLVEESESIAYQSIDEAREYWQQRYENVFVTYGKDKEKDEILENFKENGSILISTTVIEVGISLPRLTTVVIVGAERLGLATLHQIRGRVSRVGLDGYCFLYTNDKNSKRLKEFAKTKSGFDIAELDLKFRKSGDVVDGKLQSGKMFEWIDLSSDEYIIKKAKDRILALKREPKS